MALIIASSLVISHPSRAQAYSASIVTVIVPANVGKGEDIEIVVTIQYEFTTRRDIRVTAWNGNYSADLVHDSLEGTGTINYTLTASPTSRKNPDNIARIWVRLNYELPSLSASVIRVTSETYEVTIGTTALSVLEPSATTILLYPTAPNSITITVDPRVASLPGPVNLHIAANLPPGVEVFLSADNIDPSEGATEVTLNATFDAREAASIRLPQDIEVTISATSGGFREADTLTLSLRPAEWLVMLYLAADTDPDLQGSLLNNLNDVLAVTRSHPNPKIGYVALLDLRNETTFAGTKLTGDSARLYQVRDGELVLVEDLGPTDMSEKGTLGSFITGAKTMIPSERILLVIGGHGSGYLGGVVSDHHQGKGKISIKSLVETLEGQEIDVLGLDACHMGQFEVAYALREAADYILLSQTAMPGEGFDYMDFLGGLAANPGTEPLDLAMGIVLFHDGKYDGSEGARYSFGKSTTLSAVDTSKLEDLKESLENLGGAISERFETLSEEQKKEIKRVISSFGYYQFEFARLRWHITDIRYVASQYSERITDARIRYAADGVVEAFDSAVVANTGRLFGGLPDFDEKDSNFNGLSVFLPNWSYIRAVISYSKTPIVATMPRWWSFISTYTSYVSTRTARRLEATLKHSGHQLYLHIYDEEGNHLGYEPSLLPDSREQVERGINGSDYADYGNGTKVAYVPADAGSFTFTVDGSRMEEDSEPYTLTYTLFEGVETIWSQTYEGTINLNELHITPVAATEDTITIGDTTFQGREEETYAAWIAGLEAPAVVYAGASFTVELTVSYGFTAPTEMSPGIYDRETEAWIAEEYETLEGEGTKAYSFELTAPDEEVTYTLEAGVWYNVEEEWTHDEDGYAEAFEIVVVIEEDDDNGGGGIPGFPVEAVFLGLALAVILQLYSKRKFAYSLIQ